VIGGRSAPAAHRVLRRGVRPTGIRELAHRLARGLLRTVAFSLCGPTLGIPDRLRGLVGQRAEPALTVHEAQGRVAEHLQQGAVVRDDDAGPGEVLQRRPPGRRGSARRRGSSVRPAGGRRGRPASAAAICQRFRSPGESSVHRSTAPRRQFELADQAPGFAILPRGERPDVGGRRLD
jgi:hypothetical protein